MRSILLLLLVFTFPVFAQKPDSTSALASMLNAERGFAQASVMHGRNAAFVENFAEESVIFTDKWITNARQFWKERKENAVVLKWEPEFMDIAASRDFGVSTGPWEAQEYRPNTARIGTGYFLTVWKKNSSGTWQVILDAGSSTPPPTVTDHKISFPAGADKPVKNAKVLNVKSVCDELKEREKQMLTSWKTNPVPATYASFLAQGSRIQYNLKLPTTNKDTINVMLARVKKTLTWKSEGSEAATSGDMGFTYGYFETLEARVKEEGHYVRIWKKTEEGKWEIHIEMMSVDRFTSGIGE